MRTLNAMLTSLRKRAGPLALGSIVAAGSMMIGNLGAAAATCPWTVQPHAKGGNAPSDTTLVNIVFDGLALQQQFLYGFTVTDLDLAWDLSSYETLPDLEPHGRALDVMETATGQFFAVSADSIEPHTVYLVVALAPVDELEKMKAAIEPSQPFNVSFLTRGATDVSGPLPTRSLPGFEIHASKSNVDVSQWLARHDQGMADDPDSEDGQRRPEMMVAADDIDLAMGFPDEDGIRHDVQICAYQIAMR